MKIVNQLNDQDIIPIGQLIHTSTGNTYMLCKDNDKALLISLSTGLSTNISTEAFPIRGIDIKNMLGNDGFWSRMEGTLVLTHKSL